MSSEIHALSQLKPGRGSQRIIVRLLRYWHPRSTKKSIVSMGVDLLLADEKGTMVHATVNAAYVSSFKPLLRDGGIFLLDGFDVARSNPQYKTTDFHLAIRFNATTTMVQVTDHPREIPKQVFRFRTLDELMSLANSNNQLPDVIGQISTTRVFTKGMSNDLDRVSLTIFLESGERVRVSAFDEHAVRLEKVLKTKIDSTCIVLATNINPKLFKDELYLNTSAASRFFFDDEIEETITFRQRMERSNALEKYRTVEKIEKVTISGVNDFILTADRQETQFLCSARIKDVGTKHGWNFISCTSCWKKIDKGGSKLVCTNCNVDSVIGDVRYRVDLVVDDETGTTVFTVFNNEMEKMIGVSAPVLSSEMTSAGLTEENSGLMPQVIKDLIGKRFTFQFRVSEFNFGSYHESFTVTRVFPDDNGVPAPTFTSEGFPLVKESGRGNYASGGSVERSSQSDDKSKKKKKQKIA